MVVDFCHTVLNAWGSRGQDNIGSAVPTFRADPDEPVVDELVLARDGWYVDCMIEAASGADGPPPSGTLDSRNALNKSNFFLSQFSPYFIGKSFDRLWKFQKRFLRAKISAVGC